MFPINYKFIFCFYKNKIFFDFNTCISNLKKIFPLFNSIFYNNGKFLFIGTSYIYSNSIYKTNSIAELNNRNMGVLTKFSLCGYKCFNSLLLNKKPAIVLFFHTMENYFLVMESKKKNLPTVGLINRYTNSCLIDYPIFLNSFYFYNIYIFSRFFFKYITKLL